MAAGAESSKPVSTSGGSVESTPIAAPADAARARELYLRFVEVVELDGRYPVDAYRFLQEGLEFTVKRMLGPAADLSAPVPADESDPRHVDGPQLCLGLRDLAVRRWGRMAKAVLNNWGLHTTGDFGTMVFLLVEHDFLRKTARDQPADFERVFEFDEFDALYQLPSEPLLPPEFEYAGEATVGHGSHA